MSLREILLQALPSHALPAFRTALQRVAEVPSIGDWRPAELELGNLFQFACWGAPVDLITGTAGIEGTLNRIGDAIRRRGRPFECDLSEVNAVAMVRALGATHAPRRPEGPGRTPDFQIGFASGVSLELEVTCGQRKTDHLRRQHAAAAISAELHNPRSEGDTYVWLADILEPLSEAELRVIRKLQLGERAGVEAKWEAQLLPITRSVREVMRVGDSPPLPDWWPSSGLVHFAIRGKLAGPTDRQAPPRFTVSYCTPLNAYLNPVCNKADRPQSSSDLPFVIGVDVSQLRGAFAVMRRELPEWFQTWPHISGVLVFEGPAHGIDDLIWRADFVPDKYCERPVGEEIIKALPVSNGSWETHLPLLERIEGIPQPDA